MRALVVYESMFGNTQTIARAIADGLATRMAVDVVEIGGASAAVPGDVDLLVVGGPTHAFGMSRPNTRQSAAQQATSGLVSKGQGMREWLTALPGGAAQAAAVAFDTRVKIPLIPGAARRGAEKLLRRKGFRILTGSQSFYVSGTPGPLLEGEAERARSWGVVLATARETDAHQLA
ncbi:flavodoxin [Planobispora rosea]|uniref:Flavodoxin n=1 Tax=Planobispora rosea TaxID=35762 RepID=A0A8J3S9Z5_PLARO|nr:flavodoxin domain-containing protein [Planobispora rosea]GGT03882.1 flavodoxin [Planobispora rosea]GIH88780.1 flavodoxin [Planobispora rosea]